MLGPDPDQMDTDPKHWFIVYFFTNPSLPKEATRMLLKFLVIKTVDQDQDRYIQPKMLDPDPDQMDTYPTNRFIVYFFVSPSLPKEATRMLEARPSPSTSTTVLPSATASHTSTPLLGTRE
jgi:hypothetical protein